MMRAMHRVITNGPPDGKRFIACTCPMPGDHYPIDVIVYDSEDPNIFTVRFA